MADHYYTQSPESEHKPRTVEAEYRGQRLTFHTDSGVFSRTEIDKGSAALLHMLPETITGEVLDMGCGYGAIGVSIGKANSGCTLTMVDINARAIDLATMNAKANGIAAAVLQGDGFAAVQGQSFDLIVTNPPIRAGKQIIYRMFADAAIALRAEGAFMLVIRKQQGAPSALNYLQTLFRTVSTVSKKGGFWVIRCEHALTLAEQKRAE